MQRPAGDLVQFFMCRIVRKICFLYDIQVILRRVKKELGSSYLFFNGIFSDELHVCQRGRNGTFVYNFAYTDRILDFLMELDLLPFLSFSYMPAALARHPEQFLFQHLKSCYIVKNILENYDRLDSFSYWSLSDLMSEAPLPDHLLFGGLGLFTKDGLPKASYQAMCLMGQLGSGFLASGKGWFATKTERYIRIITYHYVHLSRLYATGEKFIMTPKDRYTMFQASLPLTLSLSLQHMENRSYKVKEYLAGRRSGSLYDACEENNPVRIENKI